MNAPDKAIELKALLTAVVAFLTTFWGWLGWTIVILVTAMILDYITGTWAARKNKEWSSAVARDGLWHKLGEIVALLVAVLCDIAVQVLLKTTAAPILEGFDFPNVFTPLVAFWYIFTEAGSIIENAGKLGAPIPEWLRKGIAVLQRKADAADPLSGVTVSADHAQGSVGAETQPAAPEDPQLPAAAAAYTGRHEPAAPVSAPDTEVDGWITVDVPHSER